MTNVYIIGSNRFDDLKKRIYDSLLHRKDVRVQAVGFSSNFNEVLINKNYEALHALEDKAIEEADLIILVDGYEINDKPYVGKDTQREVDYCKSLNKKIYASDILLDIYLKKKA